MPDSSSPQLVFEFLTRGSGQIGPNNVYEVGAMNLDGSARRQLTSDGKQKFLPHFSPDGTKLVYTKYAVGGYGDPTSRPDIAVLDLATGKETVPTNIGTAAVAQASWSPDGKSIAFISFGIPNGQGGFGGSPLMIMNPDGSNQRSIGGPSGAPDDLYWSDIAWSAQDWIVFVVGENVGGCSKTRTDKIRPDGTSRTQLSDGGPNCTPAGASNPYGDADPGWSADGRLVFSSRGIPPPSGLTAMRHVYAFESDAWFSGKPETDLQAAEPDCASSVPKESPDGERLLAGRNCALSDGGMYLPGLYVADVSLTALANWTPLVVPNGFGGDWNPAAK